MKDKKIMKIYALAAVLAGAAFAIWRALLIFRYSDPYDGTLTASAAPKLTVFGIAMLVVILALATSYVVLRRANFAACPSTPNQLAVFSSSFCGTVFLAAAVILALYFGRDIFTLGKWKFFSVMQICAFLAMIGAAIYFLFSASVRRAEDGRRKLLSFFPAVFALFYLSASYVNKDYIFNDPTRILCNTSLAALLLFFLLETGNAVGYPKNAARFAVSLIALVTASAYFLPLLVSVAFWEVGMTKEFVFEAVEGGTLFFILAVIYTMVGSVRERAKPEVAAETGASAGAVEVGAAENAAESGASAETVGAEEVKETEK